MKKQAYNIDINKVNNDINNDMINDKDLIILKNIIINNIINEINIIKNEFISAK